MGDKQSLQFSGSISLGIVFAVVFAFACFFVVLVSSGSVFVGREITLSFLVIAPFLLLVVVVLNVSRSRQRDFTLVVGDPPDDGAPPPHAAEDEAHWKKRRVAIETSWTYEKDRILRSQRRVYLQALIFGDVATFALACCVLVLPWDPWRDHVIIDRVACSVAAATSTAFLVELVRVMLRISGGDATIRTFAWAARSLVLAIVANLGLYMILDKEMSSINSAVLLGIFVGATGGHAIQVLLEKAAKAFYTTKNEAAQKSSPLLDIEGMTAAHVDRLEEEGILSVHDLAFVPTARLFFATAYSLQQICNWQDRALLLVYVGKKSAEALAETMDIR